MNKMHRAFAAHGPQQTRSFADQWPLQPIVYRGKLVYLYSITCQMLAAAASVCCLAQKCNGKRKGSRGGREANLAKKPHFQSYFANSQHSFLPIQFQFGSDHSASKAIQQQPSSFDLFHRRSEYRLSTMFVWLNQTHDVDNPV